MTFGHDDTAQGARNDVWALDATAGRWARLREGDVLDNTSDIGTCDFPPDFNAVEDGSPERRYSVGVAATDTEAYFFGGKADCGYLNDVWRLDVGSGAWTLERASTGGEVCLRAGRADCVSLCF